MQPTSHVRIDELGPHRVARLLDRQIFDDRVVREVTDQLLRVAGELPIGGSLIVDCSQVQSTSSSLLGRLILVHKRLDAAGGLLVLCELSQSMAAVLRSSNLDRFFKVCRDRAEAIERVQGRAPEAGA
jgi:anti-anti-sigma factor